MEKKKSPLGRKKFWQIFHWGDDSTHPTVTAAWRATGANATNTVRALALGACPQGFWLRGCSQSFCCMLQVVRASLISPLVGTNASDVPLLKGHLKTWHSILCCCNVSFVIAEIPVSYVMLWKLTKVFSRFGRDLCNTLWDVCHIEVVLLSRPFWMLIQQLTTAVHFCVTCWMNLHVNCRPK